MTNLFEYEEYGLPTTRNVCDRCIDAIVSKVYVRTQTSAPKCDVIWICQGRVCMCVSVCVCWRNNAKTRSKSCARNVTDENGFRGCGKNLINATWKEIFLHWIVPVELEKSADFAHEKSSEFLCKFRGTNCRMCDWCYMLVSSYIVDGQHRIFRYFFNILRIIWHFYDQFHLIDINIDITVIKGTTINPTQTTDIQKYLTSKLSSQGTPAHVSHTWITFYTWKKNRICSHVMANHRIHSGLKSPIEFIFLVRARICVAKPKR